MDLKDTQELTEAEKKRLAPWYIYEALRRHSDEAHPMKQDDIIYRVKRDFDVELERRAVGRDVKLLERMGIEMEGLGGRSGIYLCGRDFEDSELHMLIDGVLSSRYINDNHARGLVKKLGALGNEYFEEHINNISSVDDFPRSSGDSVLYKIGPVDEAISKGRQLTFKYNRFVPDKKRQEPDEHTVSPYRLLIHSQRYYLVACNEAERRIFHYRLDRMKDITVTEKGATPLESLPGYENGIDYREMATAHPYMYTDTPETVVFLVDKEMVDQVVDWFGEGADISDAGDRYRVFVKVSPQAMEYWAMQYLNYVEIVSPWKLRERVAGNLDRALRDKYRDALPAGAEAEERKGNDEGGEGE